MGTRRWPSAESGLTMTSARADMVVLCQAADIPEGEARGILPGPDARRKVIVTRKDGELYAYLDSCPHYAGGTPMAWKTHAYLSGDRRHIACAAHGALFAITTGDCVQGPCLGRRLTRVPLHLNDDGTVSGPAHLATPGRART